jgi:hypothetical protein
VISYCAHGARRPRAIFLGVGTGFPTSWANGCLYSFSEQAGRKKGPTLACDDEAIGPV